MFRHAVRPASSDCVFESDQRRSIGSNHIMIFRKHYSSFTKAGNLFPAFLILLYRSTSDTDKEVDVCLI